MGIVGHWSAVACLLATSSSPAVMAGVPAHDQMLRELIQDAALGRIQYQTLSVRLADAVRSQADTAKSELSALGALRSITLRRTENNGTEIYRVDFDKGSLDWAFHVDGRGLIDNAIYRRAKVDP